MQFQQRQFSRTTLLAFRAEGLFVGQYDKRGRADLAVEIPYEEVLPVRLKYYSVVPSKSLAGTLLAVAWLLFTFWADHGRDPGFELDFGLWAAGLLGLWAAYVWVGLRYRWRGWLLHTAHLQLRLADLSADRTALRTFTDALQAHTKSYLRREYAPVNPLGLIEPQLRRLAWLHELDVLSTPEAQALATRLTGRLPGRPLRSMGQKLEAPYVN